MCIRDRLMVYLNSDEISNFQPFENELNNSNFINSWSGISIKIPDQGSGMTNIKVPGNNRKIPFEIFFTGRNFFTTMGIKILTGREFSSCDSTAGLNPVIINEEAARTLNLTNPINTKIGKYTIVGISKDFNIHSLHRKICLLYTSPSPRD